MSGTTKPTFACSACGKRFTWKPEFTGRKVACSCGHTFAATLGLESAKMQGDVYDMAQPTVFTGEKSPTAKTPAAPPLLHLPPVNSAKPTTLSSVATAYPRRKSARINLEIQELDPEAERPFIHLYFPWMLLIFGAVARVVEVIHFTQGSMRAAILLVIIDIHLNALVMIGGAFIAAAVLGVNFGSLSRASIKLAGIAIFSGAAAALVSSLDQASIRGLIIGMHLAPLLYFALFYALFDLDLQESLTTVIIVWALQWVVAVALYSLTAPAA